MNEGSSNSFSGDMLDIQKIEARIDGHEIVAGVQPNCGANLVSLQVDGEEYIFYDECKLRAEAVWSGCFIMFPTPCRVPEGRYQFQGRTITQTKGGRLYNIHGLARDERFQMRSFPDRLEAALAIAPGSAVHEGFPFPGELRISMRIIPGGLEYGFCFENRGATDAPVGFGVHPYWRLIGRRGQTHLRLPCEKLLVLEKLVPTGATTPVVGTAADLRNGRCLEGLFCDSVYVDRIAGAPAWIEHRDIGKRLTLRADSVFTHMIAYAPQGEEYVCLENLTCAPNAVNLQGVPAVSGFRTVAPGQSFSGTTRFVVEDI